MCRKDLAQVYAQDRERQGGGVLTRAVGPKPVNRHASTAERVRAPRPPRPRARADTARARAADADQLTPIRRADTEVRAERARSRGRGMAYARNVRVKETHSIASQLIDTVCIICPFVSIIVLHSGAGRRARRRRSGAAQITKSRYRARDGDTSDRTRSMRCAKSSHKIVATWPNRAPQRPTAQSDLLLPNLQRGTRSLYPSTPSGIARL